MSRLPHDAPDAHESAYYAGIEQALRKANVSIEDSFDAIRVAIMTLLDEILAEATQHCTTVFVPRKTTTRRQKTSPPRGRGTETCH